MEKNLLIIFITIFLITQIYNKIVKNISLPKSDLKSIDINYDHIYDYIIIGSGPAGLQTGYYLEKFKKDYLILEKSDSNGSFFKKYPIQRKLISINKVNTGSTNKDFNLRHDWNSLLSDDDSLLFTKYTKELFPHADYMVQYLDDYQNKNNIKVSYNSLATNINKLQNGYFEITTSEGKIRCKKLIVAAGLMKNNISTHTEGVINYKDTTNDKKKFTNKNVCIIGQGNAAFETANYLSDTAAVIQLYGRGPLNFAWDSHYPGHLRAVNNDFLDLYNLKSQHSMISFEPGAKMIVKKNKNKKYFILSEGELSDKHKVDQNYYKYHVPGSGIDQHPENGFDYVIDCTGFNIDDSLFINCKPKHNGKVPYINGNFESVNIKNLFFAGVLSQEISYKYGSAAFIHGFRYLASSMVKMDTNKLDVTIIDNKQEINKKILNRINTSSALFQMYNCMCDVIIFNKNKFIYIYEINYRYAKANYINNYNKVLLIGLKYGKIYNEKEETIKNKNGHAFGAVNYYRPTQKDVDYSPGVERDAKLSIFIHPVFELYVNNKYHSDFHLAEHLLGEFKLKKVHIDPLKRYIDKISLIH